MNNTYLIGLLVVIVLGYLILTQTNMMPTSGNSGEEEQTVAAVMDKGEATNGRVQEEGPTEGIPMNTDMGYPSGILPGKVGTFHPTKDCDRYLCQGCWTCSPIGHSGNTDDQGRNYPQMIDAIRASRTNEYPFYKMN